MYFLTTSGIGYSEQLCKDVVDWFITKFLPRHKLYIDIRHDDLKNDYGTGFCDVCSEYGDIHRPRDFVIENGCVAIAYSVIARPERKLSTKKKP